MQAAVDDQGDLGHHEQVQVHPGACLPGNSRICVDATGTK